MEHTHEMWHRKGRKLDGMHGPRAGRGQDKKFADEMNRTLKGRHGTEIS